MRKGMTYKGRKEVVLDNSKGDPQKGLEINGST